MRAAVTMWRYPRMIILVLACAAVYATLLVPFKNTMPVIPGVTEIRIASIVPVVFGLLFGPAGAWGAAIGNLIGDTSGPLDFGTAFGFVGNFSLGYLPYVLWGRLGPLSHSDKPGVNASEQWPEYLLNSFLASAACAVIIGWGLEIVKGIPFVDLTSVVVLNNTLAAWVGGVLLFLIRRPITMMGLEWQMLMSQGDVGKPANGPAGVTLVVVGAVGGVLLGIFLLPATLAVPVVAVFVAAIVVGEALL